MTHRIARAALALTAVAAVVAAWAQDFDAPIVLPRADEASLVDYVVSRRGQAFMEAVAVYGSDVAGRVDRGIDSAAQSRGAVTGGAMTQTAQGRTLQGSFDALADTDRQAQAAFDNDPGPSVPSSCAGEGACNTCYVPAVEKIDFNRYWLLRARILTVNTLKVGKAGLAMLDAVTGMAKEAGPVLQARERPAIENRLTTLRAKYEEKAAVYLSGLEGGMRALGECEALHFGTRDWYQRYGYLYVSFMRERYATAPE